MPRIDPTRLLCCLKPLLNLETGGIKSERDVDKLFGLMSKFSKKLVSKCTYINILSATTGPVLDVFMERGGWSMIHEWILDAKTNKNHQLLNEILRLLLHTPATINRLKENTLPKEIKQISSKWEKEETKVLAEKVVHKWISIAKNESQQQTSLSSHCTSSSTIIPISTTSPQVLNHSQQQQPQQHHHLPISNNISNTSSFIIMQNNNNMSMGHQQSTQMSDSINSTSTVVNPSVNNNGESNNQTIGLPFERDPSSSMEIDGNYDYMNDLQIQDSELNMMDVMDNFNPDLFTKTIDQLDNFTENDNNFQLSASNSGNNNNSNNNNSNNNILLNDMGLQQQQQQSQPHPPQQQSSQLPFLSSTEEPIIPSIVIKSSGGQHSIVNSCPTTTTTSSTIPNSIGSENVHSQDSQNSERICYVVHNGQKFLLKLPSQPITNNCQTIGLEKGNIDPNNHQQQHIQLIMTQDQQVTSSSSSPAIEIVTQTVQEGTLVPSDGNIIPSANQVSPTKRRRPRKDPTITKRTTTTSNDIITEINPGIEGKGTSLKKVGDTSSSTSTTTTATNAVNSGTTSTSKNDNKVPEQQKDGSKIDGKTKLKSTKDSSHKSSSSSKSTKSSSSSSKSSSSKRSSSSSSSKAALEAERAEEEKIRQQTKEAKKRLKERELEKKKLDELEKQKLKDSKTLQETYGGTAKPSLAKIPKIPNKKKDQPSFTDLIGVPGAKDEPIKKISKDNNNKHQTDSKIPNKSSKDSSNENESTTTTNNSSTTENSGTVDVGFGAHAKPETSKLSTGAPIRRVKVFQSSKSKTQDFLDTMLETTKTKSKTDTDSSNPTTTTTSTTTTTTTTTKPSSSTISFEAALMGSGSSTSSSSSSNRKSKTLSPDSGKDNSKRVKLDSDSNSRTDKKDGKSSSSSSERRKSSESKKSEDKSTSISSKENKTTKSAIQESSFFMDSINATRESSKSNKKPNRIRRLSSSTDESKSNLLKEQAGSSSSSTATTTVSSKDKTKDDTSTTDKMTTPVFNFYRDTLNDDDEEDDKNSTNTNNNNNKTDVKEKDKETLLVTVTSDAKDSIEKKESIDIITSTPSDTNIVVVTSNKGDNDDVDKTDITGITETNITKAVDDDIQEIQDDFAPVEGEGKLKSCLCIHRPKGKPKKAVKWREEDELKEFHFFEMDETERVNVSKQNRNFLEMKQHERSEEKKSIQRKVPLPGDSMEERVTKWPLKLQKIWIDSENPVPEDLSQEKRIQEEREKGILQVFYFPGSALPDHPSEIDVIDMEIDRNIQPRRIPDENIPGHTQYYDLTKSIWPTPKYQNNRERITGGVINPILNNPLQSSSSSMINPSLSLPTSLTYPPPPTQQQHILNTLTNPLAAMPNLGFPPNPSTNVTNNYSDIFNPWNQALAAAAVASTPIPTNDPWKIAAESSSSVPGFLPTAATGIIPPFGFNFPPPQIPSNFTSGIPGQFGDLSTGTNLNIPVGSSNNNSRNLFNNNSNNNNTSNSSNSNQITRARDMDYRELGSRRSNHDDRSSDRGDRRDRNRDRDSRSNRDRDYRERDRHSSSSSSSYDKDRDYRHSDRGSYSRGRAPNGRRLCSYFAKGFCREGSKCTFYHPSPASTNGPVSTSSHDSDKRFSSPPRTHDKSSSSAHVQDSPSSINTVSSSGSSQSSNSDNNNSGSRTEIPQIASPNQDENESSRFDIPPESPTNYVFGTEPPKVIPTFVDEDNNWE